MNAPIMGNSKSRAKKHSGKSKIPELQLNYRLIMDRFETYDQLEEELRRIGLESCQLVVGIDFTKSNTWQGGDPYYIHKNLHHIGDVPNPYQQVLRIMCSALANFDNDQWIDAYGFGDTFTEDKSVFSLNPTADAHENIMPRPCHRLEGVMESYNYFAKVAHLAGPTSFAPIIREAIRLVQQRNSYHILVIIADGAVNKLDDTINAIVDASKYPLSIVCVGVGRGPWDEMIRMDGDIPRRAFDNFQFVDFHKIMTRCENEEVEFAKHALMEIPDQYQYIKKHIME